ncbi:DUF4212 domain-containing protein [Aliikangiella sp. G2MR2-5]|uniref:DUF4212 domain-containing protein n=1 Tax=Aliikangiella sp. G2MR2-5 TaxID=2788943 RepID=UPI0018ABDB45|nr:DUF4212 domain-containing protein [Aliikangiella sp. G2MR2-5]
MSNSNNDNHDSYWRANIKLVLMCLVVWFVVSFGFGVLLVDQLNTIRLGGFKLGFWFAQQGSIYTFLALIFFYVHQMNKLDKKYNVHD